MNHLKTIFFAVLCLCLIPALSQAAQVGEQLPYFKVKGMDGQFIDMSQFIGRKPVVLVFWTSWCGACKAEVPKMNSLVKQFRDKGMEFIAINSGANDTEKRARSFMKKTNMAYPVLFDKNQEITYKYGIFGWPTIIVADRHGIIQYVNHAVPRITDADFMRLNKE